MTHAKNSNISILSILALLLVLSISFFSLKDDNSEQKQEAEIKIGFVGALSGPSAFLGQEITRGANIAIKTINANGGVLGRPLTLVARDDEHTPTNTLGLYRELIERVGVVGLLGATNSASMLGVVPKVNNIYKVPVICPATDATAITENTAKEEGKPNYIFRVGMYGYGQANFMVDTAIDKFGYKKIALLTWSEGWGVTGRGEILRRLEERGIVPIADETYGSNDVDMSAQLLKIRNSGAEVILNYGLVVDNTKVMKSRLQIGDKTPYISAWGIAGRAFSDSAGDTAEGVLVSTTVTIDGFQSKKRKQFIEAYESSYGEGLKAPVFAIGAYDAIYMFAQAIESGSSAKPEDIRSSLEKLSSFDGLVRNFDRPPFSEVRHNSLTEEDMVIARMTDGKLIAINFDNVGPYIVKDDETTLRIEPEDLSLTKDKIR